MNSIKRSLGLISNSDLQLGREQEASNPKEEHEDESSVKVKLKLMSMWNNVKYGKTMFSVVQSSSGSFSGHHPVWVLGKFYQRKRNSDEQEKEAALHSFYSDFSSRIWLTYRREFEQFEGTTINTDCGWGCMIRSGQMLIANALSILHLGRDWRWKPSQDNKDEETHRSIVRLFGDNHCDVLSPFSIHKLMSIASLVLDKHPGDWFGPAATAHILKAAVEDYKYSPSKYNSFLDNFQIYVAHDTTVYIQDILDLCEKFFEGTNFNVEEDKSTEQFDVLSHLDIDEEPIEALDLTESLIGSTVPYLFELGEKGFVTVERGFSESPILLPENGFVNVPPANNRYSLGANAIQKSPEKVISSFETVEESFERLPSLKHTGTSKRGLNLSLPDEEENCESVWCPVIVLIPVRLGTSKINPIYYPCLQTILADPNCVGIIGGRPKHSLYFLGFQEDNLIHLDPHLVQDKVDVHREAFNLNSFHCQNPRKMTISKMDPSCCFGFLLNTKHQFFSWYETMSKLRSQSQDHTVFTLEVGRSRDVERSPKFKEKAILLGDSFEEGSPTADGIGTEDFVFL